MKMVSKLKALPAIVAILLTLKAFAGAAAAQAQEVSKQAAQENADAAIVKELIQAPPELSNLTDEQRSSLQHMLDHATVRESLAHSTESEYAPE